jgi:hypothetical protein
MSILKNFLRSSVVAAGLSAAISIGPSTAQAAVIGFDDLSSFTQVANGYQGFNWDNTFAVSGTLAAIFLGPSNGFTNGVISPGNVGFNGLGGVSGFSSATNFSLQSLNLTSLWNSGMNVLIEALDNGSVIGSLNFLINTSAPTLAVLNWSNLDQVRLTASGGTPTGTLNTTQFAIEDISVGPAVTVSAVPLPAGVVFLGTALFGVAGIGRIRSKTARTA